IFFPGIFLPFLLMILLMILVIYQQRNNQQAPSLRRSLGNFKINLILLAVCVVIAAAATYGFTAVLNDAAYPNVPEDVQTAEQVLNYLQEYNRAIRTNTYALLWFFYGLTAWFLTTLYAFAQAVVKAILARSY
ncbi:MAG: hypothetical protein AAGE59_19175, partial [Cyanobacteria bacterium P01_F01_bin.86]